MPLVSVPLQGKRPLATEWCCFLWHTPPALKLKVAYHKEKTCVPKRLWFIILYFFCLSVLTPLSRYFIKINLLGLKLKFKATSSYLKTFVIFMVWQPARLYLQKYCADFSPPLTEKGRETMKGERRESWLYLECFGVGFLLLSTFLPFFPHRKTKMLYKNQIIKIT